ncbi:response regulator transcription factor [Sporomusa malonica]|uniref:DNA-binding response regulator, OmpR family, contains REC and winged-helix (WHTH) domain n=1 Tax=Sporomusa malonica TaxID=112901 RepID=A0A1W2C3J7_9FIRM|nr:response regulator transcription factor [Sporomusa malonica]SMC79759.1 DNA-binding response regulator, OmpR family, contains REC and winged-helix (wHTH) domain [Sporomusa malonica]
MAGKHILVVDDEPEISDIIRLYLTKEGFLVTTATAGSQAIELARQQAFDLAILDIILPEIDGLSLARQLRQTTDLPVIFLSCKSEEEDKIAGLGIADDYVTKPFSPGELVARVKAHLRRKARDNGGKHSISYEGLEIDLPGCSVYVRGAVVSLSTTEFQLLTLLACNPDRVYSAAQLFEIIWKAAGLDDARTVAVHISNLRKKIETDPANPKYILTCRGFGYKFSKYLTNL